MADKAISELVSAEQITATDMFVLEQNGTAKKLTGQVLLNWLTAAADGHGGIQSYELIRTEGLVKTYRFTLADQTYMDIQVADGRGISSITKTGTSGLVDTYQISYNDSTTGTFTVTNGAKGDKGDNSYIWVKYASQEPTAASHSFGDVPDVWIGVYYGTLSTAPTDWQQYRWFKWKGEKGDTGDPAILMSATVTYQAGTSGTVIPSGSWSSSIPSVVQGQYLWTKIVQQFNTGNPITAYSVSRMGLDGLGSVVTVNNVSPDGSGNVALDAASVKALAITGGTMEGNINMNGQRLTGLNAPTQDDEAASKGYVDDTAEDIKKSVSMLSEADNSDFTQWVAQAGIGQKLEPNGPVYAGDRWILDSGTVTGEANANGNGYRNITLNGTIRQIVANPPAVGSIFVETISGTATAIYQDGEILITSNGGVLRNVLLCDGEYTEANKPKYQPKGYRTELAECRRYYKRWHGSPGYHIIGTVMTVSSASKTMRATLPVDCAMRVMPTLSLSGALSVYMAGVTEANPVSSYSVLVDKEYGLVLALTVTNNISSTMGVASLVINSGAILEASANL